MKPMRIIREVTMSSSVSGKLQTISLGWRRLEGRQLKWSLALLPQLPNNYRYKLIFMHRRMEEILSSQKIMLGRRKQPPDKVSDEKMAFFFHNHLRQIEKWIDEHPNIDVVHIDYNEMLTDSLKQVERINQFLGKELDTERMIGVVDRTLYRERQPKPAIDESA